MNKLAFDSPVTIVLKSVTVDSLRYTVIDDGRTASARFAHLQRPLILWGPNTAPTYGEVGDYTQAQIEARVAELLATPEDIQALVSESQAMLPQA